MAKRLIGLGLIIIGCIGILNAVTKDSTVDLKQLRDKHNLALRQVVHKLYLIAGDKTSKIAKVEHLQKSSYKIRIEKDLNYDTLPYLIDQAILDFELNKEYYVTIHNCEDEAVLLGFNNRSVENQVIPCQSRDHEITCSFLNITFPPKETSQLSQKLGFSLLSLFGVLVMFLTIRKKSLPSNQKDDTIASHPIINIGQFQYDPYNLILTLGENSSTLTFRENKLLNFMCQNINQVIKREDIMAKVWEEEGLIVGRSLDVFISRLRKLLKADNSVKIKSVHGVGYRLVVGV